KISEKSSVHSEWFFSQALFGKGGLDEIQNQWLDIKSNSEAGDLVNVLKDMAGSSEELCFRIAHELAPRFIDDCLATTDWSRYMVVGFTVTFCQSVASLFLAKRIKEKYPAVRIVFGGA